jgi:hypothetical protein
MARKRRNPGPPPAEPVWDATWQAAQLREHLADAEAEYDSLRARWPTPGHPAGQRRKQLADLRARIKALRAEIEGGWPLFDGPHVGQPALPDE